MLVRRIFLKNVATIVASFAVCAMMSFSGCKKDDNGGGGGGGGGANSVKFSPPAWIQGSWGYDKYEVFKFTKDDFFMGGISFKTIWNVGAPGWSISFKETKNTDSLYELTVTARAGGETASGIYSFKKGDGTYIEAAVNDEGTTISADDYERFDRIN